MRLHSCVAYIVVSVDPKKPKGARKLLKVVAEAFSPDPVYCFHEFDDCRWVVTHIPSGMYVLRGLSKRVARRMCGFLEETNPVGVLFDELNKKLYEQAFAMERGDA